MFIEPGSFLSSPLLEMVGGWTRDDKGEDCRQLRPNRVTDVADEEVSLVRNCISWACFSA